jgi:hypothetical protein
MTDPIQYNAFGLNQIISLLPYHLTLRERESKRERAREAESERH